MKALHLDDNWVAFSAAIEDRFNDRQETGKDHEKLLALKYACDMQTYIARFNELNSRVQLTGQSPKRVLSAAVTPDMYRNIWRKYGKIPDTDRDQLHEVREAGIQEEELVGELAATKQIARPPKEKEKEDPPKGMPEEKVAQTKEMGAAVPTGGKGPNINDKLPEQEILWESFKAAMKDVPEDEAGNYRTSEADCRRCRRDGHKTRACYAQTTSKGTKLHSPPKKLTNRASAAGTKRTQDNEPGKAEDHTAVREERPKKAYKTTAAQRKVWEEESELEKPDTDMPDFPYGCVFQRRMTYKSQLDSKPWQSQGNAPDQVLKRTIPVNVRMRKEAPQKRQP